MPLMSAEPATTTPSQTVDLLVFNTIKEAYVFMSGNLVIWARLSVVPMLMLIVFAAYFYQLPGANTSESSVAPLAISLAATTVISLAEIPLATAWHRAILIKSPDVSHGYRVGSAEFRYLVKFVLIFFVAMMILVVVGIVSSKLVELVGEASAGVVSVAVVLVAVFLGA